MLQTYSGPALFGPMSGEIRFHYPDSTEDLGALLGLITSGIDVGAGYPEGILELNDVFVVPGASTSCLYDNEGRRIVESCVRRGEKLDDYVGAEQERIELPTDCARISTPILFLSMYFRHWGHFLTESTSRLWARCAHPELRDMDAFFAGFVQGFKRVKTAAEFLNGMSSPPRMMPARGPARIDKCFVPMPSFLNRAAARAGHLACARDVAAVQLRGETPVRSGQAVYLSRSRLRNVERVVANETELERILERAGVRIAHPQEMSLREQILLFNSHSTLLGCAGSAQHNLMFALSGKDVTTHILSETVINRNCLMIDAIVGNASHYACVLRDAATSEPGGSVKTIEIDMTLAAEYLRNSGIL